MVSQLVNEIVRISENNFDDQRLGSKKFKKISRAPYLARRCVNVLVCVCAHSSGVLTFTSPYVATFASRLFSLESK